VTFLFLLLIFLIYLNFKKLEVSRDPTTIDSLFLASSTLIFDAIIFVYKALLAIALDDFLSVVLE
jgi:hypothetical protein